MLCVDLEGWDGGQWEEAPEGGDIYIYAVCAQSCSTLSCTDHVIDHALITWISCTDHVADHTLFTCLTMH